MIKTTTPIGTEIKPVGLDRTDPQSELRRAFITTIVGLRAALAGKDFGSEKTSAAHLRWMCAELLGNIRVFPVDKMGRWVGFIQGVMVCHGALDVDTERDRTRPLFEDAYAHMKRAFRVEVIVNGQRIALRWGYPDTYRDIRKRALEAANQPDDPTWKMTDFAGNEVALNELLEPTEMRTQKPLNLMPMVACS
jgi:hypothetical protein